MASFPGVPEWLSSRLEARLVSAGFTRTGKNACRTTQFGIDVVTIESVTKALCDKWNAPYGSITMEPGRFLPFVPSRERAGFECARAGSIRKLGYLDCQIRFAVRRGIGQRELRDASNLWFTDPKAGERSQVLQDMLRVLESDVLPFFADMADPRRFLPYLRTGKDNFGSSGIWNIGKLDSFRRFYLIGFVALETGDWVVAQEALEACIAVAESKNLKLPPEVMSCLKRAASLAAEHQRLPGSAEA